MKPLRQLEQIVKGFSNHRRIQILIILDKKPELSLFDITDEINVNFRTASEHVRRLVIAGLVTKRYHGRSVQHTLTRRGKIILTFLGKLE